MQLNILCPWSKNPKNQEGQAYLPSGAVHHDRQVRWIHQLSRVRYKGYESRNFCWHRQCAGGVD